MVCFNRNTPKQTPDYLCIQPEKLKAVYANTLCYGGEKSMKRRQIAYGDATVTITYGPVDLRNFRVDFPNPKNRKAVVRHLTPEFCTTPAMFECG
jgi:hypothetical protein